MSAMGHKRTCLAHDHHIGHQDRGEAALLGHSGNPISRRPSHNAVMRASSIPTPIPECTAVFMVPTVHNVPMARACKIATRAWSMWPS